MSNSVHPDETPRYELSHKNILCWQRYLFLSAVLKLLKDLLFFFQNAKGFTIDLLDFLGSQAQVGYMFIYSIYIAGFIIFRNGTYC